MFGDQKTIVVTGRYNQKKSCSCMSGKGFRNGLLVRIFTLIIFLFCCDPLFALEPRDFQFRHLSSKEGLSDDKVRAILKDSHGFVWFGTWGGLNRYDGYQYKVYKKQLNNPNSLSNDIITAIHEDKNGKLWLGTIGGLNRFDPATEMFKRYVHNPQDSKSLSNDILVSITEDKNGILWIGTWGGGLIRFDPVAERFSSYLHDSQNTFSISGDYVTAVHQARDSSYWVMTRFNGLNLFDPSAQTFRHFPLSEKNEGSDWGQNIIHEDQSGTLWFTSRKALYAINPKTYKLKNYTIKNSDEFKIQGVVAGTRGDLWVYGQGKKHSLYKFDKKKKQFIPYKTKEKLLVMYGDDSGLIWIGTMRFGIMLFDQYPPKFSHVGYDSKGEKGLPDKQISSIAEDHSGNFWLGTDKNVIHWNRKTGKHILFQDHPKISSIRKTSRCWSVLADKKGKIWFTSEDYGIDQLDPNTGNLINYRHNPADKKSLTSDYTIAIISDKEDTIWIGTDKGLNRYDPDLDRFDRFYIDPSKPENPLNNIIAIFEDRNGFLWTGSWYGGLSRFDKTKGRFIKSYRYNPNDSNSISSNTVNVIHERQDGRFWVGTSNGISLFDPETEKFKHFTEEDGLPNNYVKGILEDDTKRLWLSTNKGLTLFNPDTKVFRNYDISDGLQSNQFIQGSYTKGSSGEFFFGGMNGFSYFYPERVKDNPYIPPIHITDFQLFNKSVPIRPDSILTRAIWSTDRIVLSHKQNIFSLEFASLSYRFPGKNRYRYKLAGLEKNWNEVDSKRRYVTYTHLAPGDYVFRVIGANNDGIWNEEGASIRISVTPPWWATMWFRISMVVVAIGLLAGGFRWRVSAIEARSRELEIQLQRVAQIRQAERALQKSRQNFQLLFERHHAVMLLIDPDSGEIVDANPAAATFYGYSPAEFKAMNIAAINQLDPEQIAAKRQNAKTETGNYFIFPHRLANGEIRTVEVYSTPIDFQDRKLLFSIIHDITKRKQAERALRESEEKFRTLVTNTEEIVYMVDKNGRFLLSEGKGLAKLGLKPGQVVGKSIFELYKDYPQMLAEMRKAFNGETVTNEVTVDGNYFRNWYTPHKNHEGEIIGLLGLSVNITEQKQAEQQLQDYQQRLKALASQQTITEEKERRRIAADLHDHVGQSLALARIQIASVRKHASDPGQAATLDEISDSLRHTVQETRDLIYDLSPPQLNEIGLSAAISEWLEDQVEKRYALKAECIFSGSKEPIDDDMRAILFRSVRELVTNVIKHARATRVNIRVNQDHDRIKVIVRDDGAGFDADTISQSLKTEGGFGLFSIKERMADLGGSLEIISEPGKGTEAILAVPLDKGDKEME